MTTKYIVNNVTGQTINGNLTINGDVVITGTTNTRPYKVYTALLTQSGGDGPQSIVSGAVTQGVTYFIDGIDEYSDFSNVGGPAIGTGDNTYFVATNSNTPNDYGAANLQYNTGAPVATVLENTIGNIWFVYENTGTYSIISNSLFINQRTYSTFTNSNNGDVEGGLILVSMLYMDPDRIQLKSSASGSYENSVITEMPIEIRVYD